MRPGFGWGVFMRPEPSHTVTAACWCPGVDLAVSSRRSYGQVSRGRAARRSCPSRRMVCAARRSPVACLDPGVCLLPLVYSHPTAVDDNYRHAYSEAPMPSKPRPITFTCDYCNQQVTEVRARVRVPRYCLACYPKAQRALVQLIVNPTDEKSDQSPDQPRK